MNPKHLLRCAAALASAALLTGCFHFRYVTGDPAASEASDQSWHHGLVWGIAEISDPVPVSKICPDAFGRIESQQTFLNGLVQAVTSGIYAPQTVTVFCSPGPDGEVPRSGNRPWKE